MSKEEILQKYSHIMASAPEKSLAWCNARDVVASGGRVTMLRKQQEHFRQMGSEYVYLSDTEHGTYGVYCVRRVEALEAAIQELALYE